MTETLNGPGPSGAGRPSWDEYFMEVARLAAKRSTCLRRQVGAVLVAEHRVLATGYNGSPAGLAHCLDIGCLRQQKKIPSGQRHELCRAIHAEQNAIIQAAKYGFAAKAAELYCSHQPCSICLKMLLNLEVSRFVIGAPYPDEMALNLLIEAGFEESRAGELTIWARP